MNFDLPKEQASIIKVIGVGGGGSNAVNHMYEQGIKGVDFIVTNTDQQALDLSPVPTKIQLGASLTEGMGAGSVPEVGQNAAIEDIDDIKGILEKNTKMIFVTAGMGGGTGSGAAPIIAQAAREMGLLTVGIVTFPFSFEGKRRRDQAEKGIDAMRDNVDTLLVIRNDRLREMFGNLNLSNAFAQADDVLTTAAKGIAEVITVTGKINVDFKDVNTVMKNSGVAIMGSAMAEGENRAVEAVEKALSSPLLNDNDIKGANYVLLNITYGDQEVLMDEISDITDHIQDEAGDTADVIWGHGHDSSIGEQLSVTIIATGFKSTPSVGDEQEGEPAKNYLNLNAGEEAKKVNQPIENPVDGVDDTAEESNNEEEEKELEPYLKNEDPNKEEGKEGISEEQDNNEPWLKKKEAPSAKQGQEEHRPHPSAQHHREGNSQENDRSEAGGGNESGGQPASHPGDREKHVSRLKEVGLKMRKPTGINDLEQEPAYKRRNVSLEDVPDSSDQEVSRFTLSEEEGEDGAKKAEIRKNNSFLHDKPD